VSLAKRAKSAVRGAIARMPARMRLVIETGALFFVQRMLYEWRAPPPAAVSSAISPEHLHQLEADGFAVVPHFKTRAWCEAAHGELLDAMNRVDLTTRHNEDVRVFGIESLSKHAFEFATDSMLASLACRYAGSSEALLFCMGNKVEFRDGVPYGSGGEWHRDSFKRELKAMLYLTDVEESDGPFSILRGSHRGADIVRDTIRLAVRRGRLPDISATRLKDAGDHLGEGRPDRIAVLTGGSGTLLLFDGSAIHTGLPPKPGGRARIALTIYYCGKSDLESVRSYYRPLVKLNGDPGGGSDGRVG
jgi:hypothetical protein